MSVRKNKKGNDALREASAVLWQTLTMGLNYIGFVEKGNDINDAGSVDMVVSDGFCRQYRAEIHAEGTAHFITALIAPQSFKSRPDAAQSLGIYLARSASNYLAQSSLTRSVTMVRFLVGLNWYCC